MQKKVVLFILIVVAGLAGFAIYQSREAAALKAKTAEAQKIAESEIALRKDNEERIADLEKQKAQMRDEMHELIVHPAVVTSQTNLVRPESIVSTNDEEGSSPQENFLAKMMDNPEMKKMMRSQQKGMLDLMYGEMFKQMNLAPEQREKLEEILLDHQMANMEKGLSIMKEGVDREELTKTMAENEKNFKADIKSFLGEENFAQYEDYTKSLPDRMALTQLKSQFGDNPLSEAQSSQLLALMSEERNRPQASGEKINPERFDLMLSEETMNKYFQQEEDMNQRVLQRAGQVLSPEQLKTMGSALSNNLSMQKMAMSMAGSMFGKKKSNATSQK